jgi:uncharacterized membrane protein YkoI
LTRRFTRFAVTTLAFVSIPTFELAQASEKPVAKSKVPPAVMQTVTTSYPKAKVIDTMLETDENRTFYEVRLQNDVARVDLKIEAGGRLLAQEHIMDLKIAPVAVTNAALAPPYQDWKIKRVEKVDNLETPAESGYEVTIAGHGSKREVLLAADGKLIKIEDADDKK